MTGTQIRGGLAAIAALSTAAAVHAGPGPTPLYVDASAPAGGNGSSWSQAFRDLQDALALAKVDPNPAKQYDIRVAQGVYTPDRGTGNRAMTFLVASGVTLTGGYAGMNAANPNLRDPSQFVSVLSGDLGHNDGPAFANMSENSYTVVRVTPVWYQGNYEGGVTINGFTISGGNGESVNAPGGVSVAFSADWDVTFRSCVIKGNRGWRGGGIGSECWLWVLDTTVESNGSRMQGGGIYSSEYIRLDGSTVTRNFSELGGGGGIAAESVNAEDSAITDNAAALDGGGMQLTFRGDFVNCTIAGNSAGGSGGGMYLNGYQASMTSCLIANNTAASGGGMKVATSSFSTSSLNHCTIVGNRTQGFGAAIDANYFASISNSVIAYNTGASGSAILVSPGALSLHRSLIRVVGVNGLIPAQAFSNDPSNIDAEPMFANHVGTSPVPTSWRDKDYRLLPTSLGVDAADYEIYPGVSFDVAGQRRAVDILVAPNTGTGSRAYLDLGAYETQPACAADFDGSGQVTIDDLFWFFNLYFTGNAAADVDQVNGVTVDDLFFFLNAWFRGC